MERLAQDNPHQRQTVANVLCAYLRMPYTLPGAAPADDADEQIRVRYGERMQEREVRLTAQRILATHLRPGPDPEHPVETFWPGTDLDLTGATLVGFDFMSCRPRRARFSSATFDGVARFGNATFDGYVSFDGAAFTRGARFSRARFTVQAGFGEARFEGLTLFDGATFEEDAWFYDATFTGEVQFVGATFEGDADFGGVLAAARPAARKRSSWPAEWRPADEHGPIEGREGTWHRLVRVAPDTASDDKDEQTSTS